MSTVRPGCCSRCGEASQPPGRGLRLHGHGLRDRQQRGPLDPGGKPEIVTVTIRRYRCDACGAITTVTPAGLVARKHFSGPAIALALALFGLAGVTAAEVRQRTSPWPIVGAAARGWRSLARWIGDVRRGALFRGTRLPNTASTFRRIAECAASALVAHAPPSSVGDRVALAFEGGVRMS